MKIFLNFNISVITVAIAIILCVMAGCKKEATPNIPESPPFWVSTGGPLGANAILSIAVKANGYLYAGDESGKVFRKLSNDSNWLQIFSLPPQVNALIISNVGQPVAATSGGPFFSTDNGNSWTRGVIGLPRYFPTVLALAFNSNHALFAGTVFSDEQSGGVSRSLDNGATWTLMGLSLRHVYSLSIDLDGNIYAGARGGFGSISSGLFRSSDEGITWTSINSGLPNNIIRTIVVNSSGFIFAGMDSSGMFRSINSGQTWSQINVGLTNLTVRVAVVNSIDHLYAGTARGIFRSTDSGMNWLEISSGLTDKSIFSLALDSNAYLYAGTENAGVFRSLRPTVP